MSKKILVIGKGFLGNSIFLMAENLGFQAVGTKISGDNILDVCSLDSIQNIVSKMNPDVIVNCAALTDIDAIESNPKKAYDVNAYGAKNVSMVAQQMKIKLIHVSTDSVFDGLKGMYVEEDIPNPVNEYAKSKKLGEDFVTETCDNSIIIRTDFYGYNAEGKFLFSWILNNLQNENIITAFDDVIFNPLQVTNLASMIIDLFDVDFTGILHLSSNEVMSKYQFATKIANNLGFSNALIRKGSIKESKFIAKRPLNTSLSNLKSRKILKTDIINLDDWLKSFKASYNSTMSKSHI